MQNSGLKPPTLEKFKSKIKILVNHNLLCRQFAVPVGKLQLLFLITFLTQDANAWRHSSNQRKPICLGTRPQVPSGASDDRRKE